MTIAGTHTQPTTAAASQRRETIRQSLLTCGVIGAVLYPLADIFASTRYPGFSYRDQAVSELFAIGAPTSELVVSLFTSVSTLLFLFAIGIWRSANGRALKFVAIMMALNTIDALLLWNFFPMHMRGEEPGFTDMMHGILAVDPFLLAAVIGGAVAFRGRFRIYTLTTLALTTLLAILGMSYIPAVIANQPTPWMGASERASHYLTHLWYASLAVMLMGVGRTTHQQG